MGLVTDAPVGRIKVINNYTRQCVVGLLLLGWRRIEEFVKHLAKE